jgi:hypothetical protein
VLWAKIASRLVDQHDVDSANPDTRLIRTHHKADLSFQPLRVPDIVALDSGYELALYLSKADVQGCPAIQPFPDQLQLDPFVQPRPPSQNVP